MPSLNVRLTDEQHDALVQAAREGKRSLQRQVIWQLFPDGALSERVDPAGPAGASGAGRPTARSENAPGAEPGATGSAGGGEDVASESAPVSPAAVRRRVLVERGKGAAVLGGSATRGPDPALKPRSASTCPADTEKGTRCKLCGQVHK